MVRFPSKVEHVRHWIHTGFQSIYESGCIQRGRIDREGDENHGKSKGRGKGY